MYVHIAYHRGAIGTSFIYGAMIGNQLHFLVSSRHVVCWHKVLGYDRSPSICALLGWDRGPDEEDASVHKVVAGL